MESRLYSYNQEQTKYEPLEVHRNKDKLFYVSREKNRKFQRFFSLIVFLLFSASLQVSIISHENLGICLEIGLTVAELLDNTKCIPCLFFFSSILYSWDFWIINTFHSFETFWLFLITWAVQENLASEYWPPLRCIYFLGYSISELYKMPFLLGMEDCHLGNRLYLAIVILWK